MAVRITSYGSMITSNSAFVNQCFLSREDFTNAMDNFLSNMCQRFVNLFGGVTYVLRRCHTINLYSSTGPQCKLIHWFIEFQNRLMSADGHMLAYLAFMSPFFSPFIHVVVALFGHMWQPMENKNYCNVEPGTYLSFSRIRRRAAYLCIKKKNCKIQHAHHPHTFSTTQHASSVLGGLTSRCP
jgi:hypothetical protein